MERLKELNAALNGADFKEKRELFKALKKQRRAELENERRRLEEKIEEIDDELNSL